VIGDDASGAGIRASVGVVEVKLHEGGRAAVEECGPCDTTGARSGSQAARSSGGGCGLDHDLLTLADEVHERTGIGLI
jgi:hypothetical protein